MSPSEGALVYNLSLFSFVLIYCSFVLNRIISDGLKIMVEKQYCRGLNSIIIYLVLGLMMCVVMDAAGASYKKPPFNGSIFGKRSGGVTEYESSSRTFATMCEIAAETCSAWFSQLETRKK